MHHQIKLQLLIYVPIGFDKQNFERKIVIFFDPSVLTYFLGAQKNLLIERVPLSAHNIIYWLRIFWYPLLTKGKE